MKKMGAQASRAQELPEMAESTPQPGLVLGEEPAYIAKAPSHFFLVEVEEAIQTARKL